MQRSASPGTANVVGYILAFNEERTIAEAVASLREVADFVVVVDSGSADRTVDRATGAGAECVVHTFDNFASQRNWALDHLRATRGGTWCVTIDADEWLSPELVADLRVRLQDDAETADVVLLCLRTRFAGRILRHGGFQRSKLPRVFRLESARYEARGVNEHLHVANTTAVTTATGFLEHRDVASWENYIAKHNRYSTAEAAVRVEREHVSLTSVGFRDAVRLPHLRRRWLREQVFGRMPARPLVRFLHVYVFAHGFLDGNAGFRRALFEAWQEMCTDLKAEQLRSRGGERSNGNSSGG